MRLCALILVATLIVACKSDEPCESDGDCDGFERAVCQLGSCVCEFDELQRCFCDAQERCDEVYGDGVRTCIAGACRACATDADCDRLARCDASGECEPIECERDDDCAIGVCDEATLDCVGCRDGGCPGGWRCRDDGACVRCTADDQCDAGEVCDVDVPFGNVEVVGTNQCGVDCGPTCREPCGDDPDCLMRPECVVEDPTCLGDSCATWEECELPASCELRLGDCPDGLACEALAQSIVVPVFYACLRTPCLLDSECGEAALCYEGQCMPSCTADEDCAAGTCVARVLFDGAACLN